MNVENHKNIIMHIIAQQSQIERWHAKEEEKKDDSTQKNENLYSNSLYNERFFNKNECRRFRGK